ncbi:unnamed protein product [Linum tenue]|uniref:Transmembrane protein n=1 Tax=Linum tenue TaxID=586396 RepID=A0AAV0K0G6_9ROSI|nr:unnamed protein product [Linum tenue]
MATYYNNHHNNYYSSYSYYWECLSSFSMPLHLFFFIAILFFVLGFSWYINYESAFEDLMNQLKLFLILSPLLLLLLVHCLSAGGGGGGGFSLYIPLPERDSLHRAGGSPWGVALLLVFLLYMISYQSSLQERWFPLLAR